ncbi:MAG: filamentous hemagglutinin N-terminal domain-containing protein, partial [Burkholderiales bacterium]
MALAVATCFSGSLAIANPVNPTVVSGSASFAQAGNILNITNSHNAIINWGGFSIGVNELTKFIQPSALSAVLNRVTGQDPSAILGALQSNGRVFIINPNGITFGAGAQIDVAGLVASTLNMSDSDFLAGRMRFTDGANAGNVVNQGSITGGSVYMVGKAVSNEGLITSPNGEVVLAAGNSVELVNPGTPNLRVEIVAPDNEARNLGTIAAEAGRIGIYAGLIKQGGLISADSAVASGGRILLKSTKSTTLEEGSVTSAKGTSGGEILVLSDMSEGTTTVAGTLDASATVGNGGFVETSAANVKVADSARVKTLGGASGQSGKWLIDPNDFYISAYGGDISGTVLSDNLAYGGIEIMSDDGAYGGSGAIYVNDNVTWTSSNTLTLTAVGDILFGVSSGTALDGANGGVVLNAGGGIYTNAYGGSLLDVRADTLAATAANGIGTSAFPLRTEVANANLTNTSAGDIVIANNNQSINLVANNSGGIIDVTASHIDVVGNSSASGDIFLFSPTIMSIVVSGGAVLESTSGNINLRSQNIDLSGAGMVRGNNIFIDNDAGDLRVFADGAEGGGTINSGSFSKMQLNNPASGEVLLKSRGNVFIDGPITLDPAKAETLHIEAGISGSFGFDIVQDAAAPVSVKKLLLDAGTGDVILPGDVRMGDADNMVDVLSGGAGENFRFRNAKSLIIGAVGGGFGFGGTGVRADGGGASDVDITVNGGTLTVDAPIFVGGSIDAEAELFATGNIVLNSSVTAAGVESAGVEIVSTGGSVTVNSPVMVESYGGGCCFFLSNADIIAATGIEIGAPGSVQVISPNNANIVMNTSGGNILQNGVVSVEGGEGAGIALVSGGNILQNGMVSAEGGEGASVYLAAVAGKIEQTNGSGFIRAVRSDIFEPEALIDITAASGVGTIASPLRMDMTGQPDINIRNTGASGDIAVSFFGDQVHFEIGGDLLGTFNNNASGTYFIRSEDSQILMQSAFRPNNNPLLPNQNVVLKTLTGDIIIDGYEGASIVVPAGGSGGVTLESASAIDIYARPDLAPTIAGQNVKLKAGSIYVGSGSAPAVVGGDVVLQSISGGAIDVGSGATFLTNDSLNLISAPHIQIGDVAAGPLTIVGDLNHPDLLDLRGSTISQSGGNLSTLFDAQAGTTINLNQPGPMTLGLLQAGSSISITAGSIIDGNASANIVAPTAMLTSTAGGIGSLANPLETVVASLSLNGNGGDIGIINAGNLVLADLS